MKKEIQEQPKIEGAAGSVRLSDGLYQMGKGRKGCWLYVKDGILWLPTALVSPIVWMTAGKPITIVDKRSFMRAGDLIEEEPSLKETVEALATKHGLVV